MDSDRPSPLPGPAFEALVALIARLRAPGGCPWDREQTHASLKPMLIEEAYEVLEAIDEGDDAELAGELGDLLLQVVFHSQIASEEKRFTVADVVARVSEKMVRRHPHVFADDKANTSGEVLRSWEAIKEAENAKAGRPDASMLDSVSASVPAVMEAYQMTTKVSRVGFEWPDAAGALAKLEEEVRELKEALAAGRATDARVGEEVGDLFFSAVNVARMLGHDPESALKGANRKFRRRFRHVEDRLREGGKKPADATLAEMDALWDEAKGREK
jgi:tetrapyrrole methylase family protein / MazG family protein